MAAALNVRFLSNLKEEREAAAEVFVAAAVSVEDKQQVIEDLHAALYASRACSYAQGLYLIKAASDAYNWNVDLAECTRLWMGGSVIRSKLIDLIQTACSEDCGLANLMVASSIVPELSARATPWRRLVAFAITNAISCPSLCGSLNYFTTYSRGRLPANLTQAQRDFFGGHTYERTDKSGRFHTVWTDFHKDIGDTTQRTAGEKLQTDIQSSPLEE
jgi:6-phosphogluconate dehydrogenase